MFGKMVSMKVIIIYTNGRMSLVWLFYGCILECQVIELEVSRGGYPCPTKVTTSFKIFKIDSKIAWECEFRSIYKRGCMC